MINYEYDELSGRLTRTFVGDPADPLHDVEYAYDGLGRLATLTVVERNDVTLSTPEVTTYGYDLVGNLVRVDNPNGVITEYVYDDLYRLDVMTHYEPDATPQDLSDNDKIAEYDYTVRADGRRTAVTETVWESGSPLETTIDWTYDNLGRLIEEVYDSHDDNLDFTATYTFDLIGNRIERTVDQGSDSSIDETITYTYDDNDRLLTEVKDLATGTDTTTTYEYSGSTNPGTEQTKKTVTETATSALIQTVESTYNLQGRLSEVVIETYDSGDVVKRETTTYEYNENGIRVASTNKVEVDDDQDPQTALVVESETETTYLNDPQNPTGYAQVIEEITRDTATQDVTKDLVFTLGHDVIAQTEIDPAQAGTAAGDPLFLLYDGHGSTRFLAALDAAIQEGYSYDAYGNALGFDPAAALTALLYSGEPFDTRINQQYLRARWYDLSTGRFNRLDPFVGNLRDPQSLHKYLYTHADPITFADPSGESYSTIRIAAVTTIIGSLISLGVLATFDFAARQGQQAPLRAFQVRARGGILQSAEGDWSGNAYLPTVLPGFDLGGLDGANARAGCVGLLGLRLGLTRTSFAPWKRIDGTRAFLELKDAESLYKQWQKDNTKSPWLYVLQVNPAMEVPNVLNPAISSEVNPDTIPVLQDADFNFASRLLLRDGKKTWEWISSGAHTIFELKVHRHQQLPDQIFGFGPRNIYFVSPRHSQRFIDESQ